MIHFQFRQNSISREFFFFFSWPLVSYLYPVGSTDFSRLKSVALSIVPIELVHVWWKLLYSGSKAKNQSSKDCHHKGVDKKVIILKSTSQSLTCPRRCCTGWENWQNFTNFLVPLILFQACKIVKELKCGKNTKIKNKSCFVYILIWARAVNWDWFARSSLFNPSNQRCCKQKSK